MGSIPNRPEIFAKIVMRISWIRMCLLISQKYTFIMPRKKVNNERGLAPSVAEIAE